MNIGGEQIRAVSYTLGALETRAGGRDEPGRERRGAGWHVISLHDDCVDTYFLRRQRRAEPSGPGTDDDERHLRIEFHVGSSDDNTHDATMSHVRPQKEMLTFRFLLGRGFQLALESVNQL